MNEYAAISAAYNPQLLSHSVFGDWYQAFSCRDQEDTEPELL